MEKIAIKKIEITKETQDLRKEPSMVNGKKKVYKPGHKIMCYADIAKLYLDKGVARELDGKEVFNKTTKEE